jgi:spermidine synthase
MHVHAEPSTVSINPMEKRELLSSTITPEGRLMTLSLHDGHYYIEVGGHTLMSTRSTGSERALADFAMREVANSSPRVLIGGLGLGFTLGAALDLLPSSATVVLVEFSEAIVDWNHKFSFESEIDRLNDPRVVVEVIDLVEYIRQIDKPFDAILLDVDNGPDALSLASNKRLYDRPGLIRLRQALNPGGTLAVWSAEGSAAFEKLLGDVGFAARSEAVRARGRRGEHNTIFLGQTPGAREYRTYRPRH